MIFLFIFFISQVANVKIMKIYTDTIFFPNIIIYTSLTNENGNPVIISLPSEFLIYEDGKKGGSVDSVRLFSESKFIFLFLIDVSRNMRDEDIRLVQMVLWKIFQEKIHNIMIFLFSDTLIPLYTQNEELRFDSLKERFEKVRRNLNTRGAKLIDIISFSILKFYQEAKGYPSSCIVVFSKGIDDGSETKIQELKNLCIKTQIPLFTVGINERGDILKEISDSTYGEHISGKTLNELELSYNQLSFKIRNSVLLFYKTKILKGDGMPHMIEVMVQNIKGGRVFITPKKYILRFESYFIPVVFLLIIIALFIFYNKMRFSKKKSKKLESSGLPSFKNFVEEKTDLKKELKEEIEPIKDKTQIFLPYIPVQIKKYEGEEKIIYKNREFITDTIVEMEYNEIIKAGSKEDNTLVLTGLSPFHFALRFEYSGFTIYAQEEVYINGEKVKGEAEYKEKGKYIINAGVYVLIFTIK